MAEVLRARTPDNNWRLFVVTASAVLTAAGFDAADTDAHFRRFMSFYRGEGWFSDGPDPAAVDWYNAWGIHYELLWLRHLSAAYRAPQVDEAVAAFNATLPYFISPNGFPIMGRSICYRLGVATPLVGAAVLEGAVPPGLARRALDATWRHFVPRGAIARGVITQGYYAPDLRLLDVYSGPSSALWGTRPLVFAFMAPAGSAFWREADAPLPVEVRSYKQRVEAIGWEVSGDRETGEVRVSRSGTARVGAPVVLQEHSIVRRLAALPTGRPKRPANRRVKYGLAEYSSIRPLGGLVEVRDP
jgi:hypothetical protein